MFQRGGLWWWWWLGVERGGGLGWRGCTVEALSRTKLPDYRKLWLVSLGLTLNSQPKETSKHIMVTTTEIARERLSSSNCSFSDWVPGTLAKKTLRCLLSPIFLFFVFVCLFVCCYFSCLPQETNFSTPISMGVPKGRVWRAPSLPPPSPSRSSICILSGYVQLSRVLC